MKTLYRAFDVAAPPDRAVHRDRHAARRGQAARLGQGTVADRVRGQPVRAMAVLVAVFAVLVPLCLYRGPLNIYGLGAGIAGVLITGGVYPAPAVLG